MPDYLTQETASQPTARGRGTSLSNFATYAIVIVPLMAAWGIFLYLGVGSLLPTPPTPIPIAENKAKPAPALEPGPNPTVKNQPNDDYETTEKSFVLAIQREELSARLREVSSMHEALNQLIREFETNNTALRTNDKGRRLAYIGLARKFDFLSGYPKKLDRFSVEQTLADVEEAIKATSMPMTEFDRLSTRIEMLEVEIKSNSQKFKQATLAIEQLIESSPSAASVTLDSILSDLSIIGAQEEDQIVQDRVSQFVKQQQQAIAEAESKRAKLQNDLKDSRVGLLSIQKNASTALDRTARQSTVLKESLANKEAKKANAMKSAYPAVKQLLLPFTSKGYRQPNDTRRLRLTSQNAPISYAGLVRAGALESSSAGLEKMFYLVQPNTAFGRQNDRPLGEFPAYRNFNDFEQPIVQEKLKRAQDFLIEHGDTMVREGLLSK